MLESFSVSNYKNFKDKITLNLKAANYDFNNEIVSDNKILNFAIIYGYNACGKSNLMLALFDIVYSLTDLNHRQRGPEKSSNYQNIFKKNDLVEFEYRFNFDDNIVIYNYKKKNIDEIIFEELIINDKTLIYFDKSKGFTFNHHFKESQSLTLDLNNPKLSAIKYLYANTQLDIKNTESKAFYDFMDYVQNMLLFWSLQDRSYIGFTNGVTQIIDELIKNNWVTEYNDFLIQNDINREIVVKELPDGNKGAYYKFGKNNFLPLVTNMSNGESALLLLFFWVQMCKSNKKPSLLCIDDVDAFYHIKLSKRIVSSFKKMKDIQIILTSHNSNLISNEILRSDAYFLIKENNINSLNNLTDKELRQAHNLEKLYRAGTFDYLYQ
ncbi:MAG: ATP-binding protein [Sphaerochaetaceae bacterium]|nr:ATP-binding protein [Sphaerochaetaceae bacterium]